MKTESQYLIDDLIEQTGRIMNDAEQFKRLKIEKLNYRTNPNSWSALECLEHLNLYGDFYLPEIKNRIVEAKKPPEKYFKSGVLGNYFANSMKPKKKLNKMRTFKDKNPIGSNLDIITIDRFIHQQQEFLDLLHKSRKVSLNKTKISISISKKFKLKLGDTFRFLTNHNLRHLMQAKNALEASNKHYE